MKKVLAIFLLLISIHGWAYQLVQLNGDNRDYACGFRQILAKEAAHPEKFIDYLQELNLSVDCLSKDQRRFIVESKLPIRGVTFGVHTSASKVISVEGGDEFVITVYDEHTLMVGVVSYVGGGASLSLPVGVSITRGAIHGNCRTLDNYLGNFHNFSLLGMNKSFGTADEFTDPHRTHCDASSNTVGASMSLVGYSVTRYRKSSPFVLIQGERVEELIEFITRYHPLN